MRAHHVYKVHNTNSVRCHYEPRSRPMHPSKSAHFGRYAIAIDGIKTLAAKTVEWSFIPTSTSHSRMAKHALDVADVVGPMPHSRAQNDPFSTEVVNFSVGSSTSAKISFYRAGGDNLGLLLDFVELEKLT